MENLASITQSRSFVKAEVASKSLSYPQQKWGFREDPPPDLVIIGEFSEIKGPVPLLTIPSLILPKSGQSKYDARSGCRKCTFVQKQGNKNLVAEETGSINPRSGMDCGQKGLVTDLNFENANVMPQSNILEEHVNEQVTNTPADSFVITEIRTLAEPAKYVPVQPEDLYYHGINLNDLILRLMTTDYQSIGGFLSIVGDTEVIEQDLQGQFSGIGAVVRYVTLYDSQARGFVRPVCIAYLTWDAMKVSQALPKIRQSLSEASNYLKCSNLCWFGWETLQQLLDLTYTKHCFIQAQEELSSITNTGVQRKTCGDEKGCCVNSVDHREMAHVVSRQNASSSSCVNNFSSTFLKDIHDKSVIGRSLNCHNVSNHNQDTTNFVTKKKDVEDKILKCTSLKVLDSQIIELQRMLHIINEYLSSNELLKNLHELFTLLTVSEESPLFTVVKRLNVLKTCYVSQPNLKHCSALLLGDSSLSSNCTNTEIRNGTQNMFALIEKLVCDETSFNYIKELRSDSLTEPKLLFPLTGGRVLNKLRGIHEVAGIGFVSCINELIRLYECVKKSSLALFFEELDKDCYVHDPGTLFIGYVPIVNILHCRKRFEFGDSFTIEDIERKSSVSVCNDGTWANATAVTSAAKLRNKGHTDEESGQVKFNKKICFDEQLVFLMSSIWTEEMHDAWEKVESGWVIVGGDSQEASSSKPHSEFPSANFAFEAQCCCTNVIISADSVHAAEAELKINSIDTVENFQQTSDPSSNVSSSSDLINLPSTEPSIIFDAEICGASSLRLLQPRYPCEANSSGANSSDDLTNSSSVEDNTLYTTELNRRKIVSNICDSAGNSVNGIHEKQVDSTQVLVSTSKHLTCNASSTDSPVDSQPQTQEIINIASKETKTRKYKHHPRKDIEQRMIHCYAYKLYSSLERMGCSFTTSSVLSSLLCGRRLIVAGDNEQRQDVETIVLALSVASLPVAQDNAAKITTYHMGTVTSHHLHSRPIMGLCIPERLDLNDLVEPHSLSKLSTINLANGKITSNTYDGKFLYGIKEFTKLFKSKAQMRTSLSIVESLLTKRKSIQAKYAAEDKIIVRQESSSLQEADGSHSRQHTSVAHLQRSVSTAAEQSKNQRMRAVKVLRSQSTPNVAKGESILNHTESSRSAADSVNQFCINPSCNFGSTISLAVDATCIDTVDTFDTENRTESTSSESVRPKKLFSLGIFSRKNKGLNVSPTSSLSDHSIQPPSELAVSWSAAAVSCPLPCNKEVPFFCLLQSVLMRLGLSVYLYFHVGGNSLLSPDKLMNVLDVHERNDVQMLEYLASIVSRQLDIANIEVDYLP